MSVGKFMLIGLTILAAVLAAATISPDLARPAGILALGALALLVVADVRTTKAAKRSEAAKVRAGAGSKR